MRPRTGLVFNDPRPLSCINLITFAIISCLDFVRNRPLIHTHQLVLPRPFPIILISLLELASRTRLRPSTGCFPPWSRTRFPSGIQHPRTISFRHCYFPFQLAWNPRYFWGVDPLAADCPFNRLRKSVFSLLVLIGVFHIFESRVRGRIFSHRWL